MKRDRQSECGGCGSEEPVFLFNVRHRGIYRRLCTACVLKDHLGSFCPICFEVYDDHRPPPPHERAMCLNCPSISHLSCVGSSNVVPLRYQCPTCSNPSFSFFDAGTSNKKKIHGNDGEPATSIEGWREIDKDLAKQLAAAARIALASMNKAAVVARVEAERRVKEAAVARKRAKEALDRVACLISKEKEAEKLDSKSVTGQHRIKQWVSTNKELASRVDGTSPAGKRIQNQIKADGFLRRNNVSGSPENGVSAQGNDGQIPKVG